MQYETFRAAFDEALRESRLTMIGPWGSESLDLRNLGRTYEVYVHAVGARKAEPFWPSAKVSFRWDALTTARTATNESDTLMTLFGADAVPKRSTIKPSTRIDIELRATLQDRKELPMPSPRAWAAWAEATLGRLEEVTPLTPKDKVRLNKAGHMEVLAWQGEPIAEFVVGLGGELWLRGVRLEGFQIMETPRSLDSEKRPDRAPHGELREMCQRVEASLGVWTQALENLKPPPVRTTSSDRRH
jgi:hypothetical protein